MAEMKSTMELILEKTKNLSLSEEEKETLHKNEWTGKVRGWVQKYLDDAIDVSELKANFVREKKIIVPLGEILNLELLNRIHVNDNSNNDKIFRLFRDVLEVNPEFLVQRLQTVQKDMKQKKDRLLRLLKKETQVAGISGSAVLPNLSKNRVWEARMEKLEADLHEALRESDKRRKP